MFLEIIFFSLIGMIIGVALGLLPGFHLNNIIPFLLLLLPFVDSPYYIVTLIVSTAISQIFTSFIPSIYLGAPDGDSNSLSVLPGHRLLFEGRGYEAIKLTVIGGFIALLTSALIVLFLGSYFAKIYEFSRPYITYALMLIILFMVFSEKGNKKVFAFSIILLSGIFGLIVLNSSLVPQQNSLFPTFAGLFALSTLITSIAEKSNMPKQEIDSKLNLPKNGIIKAAIFGVIAGILIGLLPAIGVSQGATLMQYIGGLGEPRMFLTTLSGINTANEVVSLNSLYLISNPRSGASVGIERIMPEIGFYDMLLFMGIMIFVAGMIAPITIYLGKIVPKFLIKLNYTKLSLGVIIFLLLSIFGLTGFYGLLIAATATGIGLLSTYLGVKRSTCMGVLIVPTLLFFAGANPFIFALLNL